MCQRTRIVQNEDMGLQTVSGRAPFLSGVNNSTRAGNQVYPDIRNTHDHRDFCPGTVSVGESILRHPVGAARIRKNAQNGCSFAHIFEIRPNCPRIAEFRGKSVFPETLMYAFGRQIAIQIGVGYLERQKTRDTGIFFSGAGSGKRGF